MDNIYFCISIIIGSQWCRQFFSLRSWGAKLLRNKKINYLSNICILYLLNNNQFYFVLQMHGTKKNLINISIFQTVKSLSPGLSVFTQSELLMEFHRVLKFGFLEGITLFSTAYETQLRKKKAEEKITGQVNNPQDSTWSGSSVKISGPRYSM